MKVLAIVIPQPQNWLVFFVCLFGWLFFLPLVMTDMQPVTSEVFVTTWLENDLIPESHPKDLLPKTTAHINLDLVSQK